MTSIDKRNRILENTNAKNGGNQKTTSRTTYNVDYPRTLKKKTIIRI